MEEKDLTPINEEEVKTEEVVAEATTDKVVNNVAEPVATTKTTDNQEIEAEANSDNSEVAEDTQGKGKKSKKDKKPMPKKKKITIITACSIVGAIVLGLLIWLIVVLTAPMKGGNVDTIALKVDMANEYYVGTEGDIDLSKIFPDGDGFKADGKATITGKILKVNGEGTFKLTFKQGDSNVEKNVTIVKGATNVSTFEELFTNVNDGKAVVIQNTKLSAPALEGKDKDYEATLVVKNNVYGNGAIVNLYETVTSRNKLNGNNISSPYLKGNGAEWGQTGVRIEVREDGAQVIFQDVHLTGNDMDKNGNLKGLEDSVIESRGLLLFSKYNPILEIVGNEEAKANAYVKHCIVENGHKVVHVINSNVKLEGTIIRNASDTTLSIATFANKASTITSKNNIIANSLTGGILFYCYDDTITEANAKASWNKLIIEKDSFLKIYNWKKQDGLSFLPETEISSPAIVNVANTIVNDTVLSSDYDHLKGITRDGQKYIHFAIIKLKTAGGLKYNGSTVEGKENIKYTDTNGKGFPIPNVASIFNVHQVDVWGYFSNTKEIEPTEGFTEEMLPEIYKALRGELSSYK
ncbi:MAG: hypothetical protein K2P12_01940 [Clostridia bacterium]|nr:hypothetical protein [Clostridia bacterium]